jgi:hypothetical protein
VKKGLVLGLAVTAVAAAVSTLAVDVSAGPLRQGGAAGPVAAQAPTQAPAEASAQAPAQVSAREIAAGVRAAGLDPAGAPRLRGRYYVLNAVDPRGAEMRVLADAQDGSILSILPVRRSRAYRPAYRGTARIIHVPQPDDAVAEADDGGTPAASDAGGADAVHGYDGAVAEPPAPLRHIERSLRPRSEAPRVQRHTVSSAPPPPPQRADADKALTPIHPTPDFGPKVGDSAPFDRLPPPLSQPVE